MQRLSEELRRKLSKQEEDLNQMCERMNAVELEVKEIRDEKDILMLHQNPK